MKGGGVSGGGRFQPSKRTTSSVLSMGPQKVGPQACVSPAAFEITSLDDSQASRKFVWRWVVRVAPAEGEK